jgi:hypothetical protein
MTQSLNGFTARKVHPGLVACFVLCNLVEGAQNGLSNICRHGRTTNGAA